jgi:pyridoxal phosphate enzyme (YggS family)
MNTDLRSILSDRLRQVRERIAAASARAGRPAEGVTLVAVTKTASAEVAAVMPELGVNDLGESRPQELWRKAADLIGHLQRNKVERTLPLVHLIHSVDSLRLLTALEQEAERLLCTFSVLLEVNASREASKHGFPPEEVLTLLPRIHQLQFVHVRGLMTMAAPEDDPERCRPTFAALRNLAERFNRESGPPHELDQLSMGMSNDFEVAIEEGATLVRLGSVLFEGLS